MLCSGLFGPRDLSGSKASLLCCPFFDMRSSYLDHSPSLGVRGRTRAPPWRMPKILGIASRVVRMKLAQEFRATENLRMEPVERPSFHIPVVLGSIRKGRRSELPARLLAER